MCAAHLPFSNRYVFAKVMQDNPELCREFVERVLDIKISHISQIQAEAEVTNIVHRSVRFDVYLDSDEAAFEVEMQTYEQRNLPVRMRYYRSQLDRRLLGKGEDFINLKPVYVIFVCTWDPFGPGLPVYTFKSSCVEAPEVVFDNGAVDVVLNASGDLSRASSGLASLLQYVETNTTDNSDPLTSGLSRAVAQAHKDEEWVSSMSLLDWDIRDAKEAAAREGRAEGRAEGRSDERARQARLMSAMEASGCEPAEILLALRPENVDAAYARYGIESSD